MLVKLGVCVLFWEGKKKKDRPHHEKAGGGESIHLATYGKNLPAPVLPTRDNTAACGHGESTH